MKRKFGEKWPVLIIKALILLFIGQTLASLPATIVMVNNVATVVKQNAEVLQDPEIAKQVQEAVQNGGEAALSSVGGVDFVQVLQSMFQNAQSSIFGESPAMNTGFQYFIFLGIWIVFLFWYAVRKKNRPLFKTLGTAMPGNNLRNLFIGLLIGFVMNALCVLGAVLCGNVRLTFTKFEILPLIGIFLCVMIQSAAEELVCRDYLYQRLRRSYPGKPWVPILITSGLFAAMHLSNPGMGVLPFIDIFASGLLFALMIHYCDSFWMVCLVHTAWNFTQNILFGLPNSGMMVPYSLFTLNEGATNGLFYDTAFGVEGTIPAIVIQLIFCGLVVLWGKKHPVAHFDPWEGTDVPGVEKVAKA